jgi:hypothetical protein
MTELIFDKNEDWDKRTLCIDESCVGTIGPDGRCRECGKPYDGSLNPATALDKNEAQAKPADDFKKNADDPACDEEWEKRVLCSDESCIGTIGSNGKCRECGKPLGDADAIS